MSEMKDKIVVTIDGRPVRADHRETVLEVARRCGVEIPTLCHHEALEPAGACRLCLVEVAKGDWSKIVTACNYPVWDGVEIRTGTEKVRSLRRMTMEALLARCPDVKEIAALAKKLGVETSRFEAADETCILCGMCTRVCESYATAAISMVGRGDDKFVGTFAGQPPEDCVGCGACAEICPTNHIPLTRTAGQLTIWDRTFDLATCAVQAEKCRGCGACEQACPFAVPRVALRKGGLSVAAIDAEACRGCGVCISACPSGAIVSPRRKATVPAVPDAHGPKTLVVACGRAGFGLPHSRPLPDSAALLELPCTGGVSQAVVLDALAAGFDGVLMLGRHEETCRLNGAEKRPRELAERLDALCELSGLGAGRVGFCQPEPGPKGPYLAVDDFTAKLSGAALKERRAPSGNDAFDGVLDTVTWLGGQKPVRADAWLGARGLPQAGKDRPALLAGAIPYFDLLMNDWVAPFDLGDVLKDGLAVMDALGYAGGVLTSGLRTGEEEEVRAVSPSVVVSQCAGCGERAGKGGVTQVSLGRLIVEGAKKLDRKRPAGVVAVSRGDAEGRAVVEALGGTVVEIDPSPAVGVRFALTPSEQKGLEARFEQAAGAGAELMLTSGPVELVQHLIATREGAWRRTHVKPVLASGLAARCIAGRSTKEVSR